MRSLRAMVWKEIREGFKFAVFIAVALPVLTYLKFWIDTDRFNQPLDGDCILMGFTVQSIMVVACPFWGLMLGILQFYGERSPDRRAFLIHRPISQSRLFAGKVLAGLVLYFVPIALPYGSLAVWSAVSYADGPLFHWRFLLPGVADMLAGVVFYLGGAAIIQRKARWWASGTLPVVLCMACSCVVCMVPMFWQALATLAIGLSLLGTLAWGQFVAGGVDAQQPRIARVTLGLAMLVSCFVVMGMIGMCGVGEFKNWYEHHSWGRICHREWTRYFTFSDGRIIKQLYTDDIDTTDTARFAYQNKMVFTDLAGHPVPRWTTDDPTGDRTIGAFYPFHAEDRSGYRNFSSIALRFSDGVANIHYKPFYTQRWYYVIPQQRFVGFDLAQRTYVGAIMPAGPNAQIRKPYGDEASLRIFVSSHLIEMPVLAERCMKTIFSPPADEVIQQVSFMTRGERDGVLPVLTSKRIYLAPWNSGNPIIKLPLECDPATHVITFRQGRGVRGRYLASYDPSGGSLTGPRQVFIYGPDGSPISHATIPPYETDRSEYEPAPLVCRVIGGMLDSVRGGMIAALPPVDAPEEIQGASSLPGILSTEYWLGVAIPLLLYSAIAMLIARAYSLAKISGTLWVLAAFALGPAAVLAFLAATTLPARVGCVTCGRKRVVTRERCKGCGAAFPVPVQNGTEIFEMAG